MGAVNLDNLDPAACGLKLYKHNSRDELIACELVMFRDGYSAVHTTLRRASLSGVVKCEPFDEPMDYFADVYVDDGTFNQTVLLDRLSYKSLKTRWMRCKLEAAP